MHYKKVKSYPGRKFKINYFMVFCTIVLLYDSMLDIYVTSNCSGLDTNRSASSLKYHAVDKHEYLTLTLTPSLTLRC